MDLITNELDSRINWKGRQKLVAMGHYNYSRRRLSINCEGALNSI